MQYRRLGSSGLQLSALSFGSWVTFGRQVDRAKARELLACAFDHGVNYFDSSETYAAGQAETILGEALARLRFPRDAFCVSSKVFFGAVTDPKPTQRGLSRKHVTDACHQALRRLRVDYLDCFFCHRSDPDTPVAETVWAMDTLIRQGKVLYWGTSEWPADTIREAHAVADRHHLHAPTMEQPQYNLLHRERVEAEYAPLYRDFGMGTTIWSPLASGILTGKYAHGTPAGSRLTLPGYEWLHERYDLSEHGVDTQRIARLLPIAQDMGVSPAQFAIAWCLKNPHVSTVMLGATRREQLEENLGALDAVDKLDADVMQRVDAALA
ncbi:MAG TPA: aldo/keto reductase [Rhodanobacteraceae bacterium]|jgi:voltage-dependent potassium channel beta subunit|nr:aldo/keto reductase [Rhodanobacteraceae bacterium]